MNTAKPAPSAVKAKSVLTMMHQLEEQLREFTGAVSQAARLERQAEQTMNDAEEYQAKANVAVRAIARTMGTLLGEEDSKALQMMVAALRYDREIVRPGQANAAEPSELLVADQVGELPDVLDAEPAGDQAGGVAPCDGREILEP